MPLRNKQNSRAQVEDEFRYERKFHAQDMTVDQVVMVVNNHPLHFVEPFPMRRINNVYFDTIDLSDYRAHILGSSRRRKVRIRWYGSRFGTAKQAVLEVKAKNGGVGTKRHFALPPLDFDGSIDVQQIRAAVAKNGTAETMSGYFSCAQPALFNSYVRRYFLSIDGRYRITIDTDMEFRVVNGRSYSHIMEYREERLRIVELKYEVEDDADVNQVVNRLPFRLSKYSKYVFGIECLRACAS